MLFTINKLIPKLKLSSTNNLIKITKRFNAVAHAPIQYPHPDNEYKTLAFYQFQKVPQDHLGPLRDFMFRKLTKMETLGRIYLSQEGINAQISVPDVQLDQVLQWFNTEVKPFKEFEFNYSTEHYRAFRKLHIRIKDELVSTNIPITEYDTFDQPQHLTAEEFHNGLNVENPPVLFDLRNHFESEVGHFENAYLPDVDTFREAVDDLLIKTKGMEDEPIYMYCTGGIRCSKVGAIMKSKGFKDINVLKGGITAYGQFAQKSGVKSLYKGRNFTFDKRLSEPISNEIIGKCHQCGESCDTHTNCKNLICNVLFIQCSKCREKYHHTCGSHQCLTEPVLKREENKQKLPSIYNYSDRIRPKVNQHMAKTMNQAA